MTEETIAAMRKLARMTMEKARASLEEFGTVTPIFIVEYDNSLEVFELKGAAAEAMESGPAKDTLFSLLRTFAHSVNASCVVIATEAWLGEATDLGKALPQEQFNRLAAEKGFEAAVQMGLITRCEAVIVSVQSREGAMTLSAPFTRDEIACTVSYGDEREVVLEPGQFSGRQKMFDDDEERLQ